MKTNQHKPPKLAEKFLEWFIRDELVEEVLGDLDEKFYSILEKQSLFKARINYWFQVLNYLRPFAIKRAANHPFIHFAMLTHTLLISFRNFKRYKTSFLINLIGLAAGLACSLMIYLWVQDEMSIDSFHKEKDRIYQVLQNVPLGDGELLTVETTPGIFGKAIQEEMPEVEEAVVVLGEWFGTKGIATVENKDFKAREFYVSNNFFDVFSFELLEGDRETALENIDGVWVSESMAAKLFPAEDYIVGKTLIWKSDWGGINNTFQIEGVFKNPPKNSSMQFDMLFSYDKYFQLNLRSLDRWNNNNPYAYLLLKEGTDIESFEQKISQFIRLKLDPTGEDEKFDWVGHILLQKYSDTYLDNKYENGVLVGGRRDYAQLFSIIALFILIIACINFMNLSTARASRRMKEVGIKKVVGAKRQTLIFQFLGESVLLSFMALVFGIFLIALLLPQFNLITGKQLDLYLDYRQIVQLVLITLFTGLIAGSYPAFYLSSFQPVKILKGRLNTMIGEVWIRKGLVVCQFVISIVLIIAVGVIYQQIDYIHAKNLGYSKDHIITFKREGKLKGNLGTFLQELENIPGVMATSSSNHDLMGMHGGTGGVSWEGKGLDDRVEFSTLDIDYDFIELMEIEIVDGRSFSEEFGMDSAAIIFNEAAIEAMGIESPIGQPIQLWGELDYNIVGIVKNFHYESLYETVNPMFIRVNPDCRNILVKIDGEREKEVLTKIDRFYTQYNQGLPFEFTFLDDEYQEIYAAEQRTSTLAKYFAGLAILISCLGLFGLAAYTAERRMKEISIRKVLGLSEWGIVKLLSKEFTQMVFVAIIIALPISYLLADDWLSSFAYKITLQWWYFFGAGILAMTISWLTVGGQALKVARINPAQSLKNE